MQTRNDYYDRIRKIIIETILVVPIIPFVVSLGIGYYYFMHSIENNTTSRMVRIVQDHGQMISSFLRERKADLKFVLESYSYAELSRQEYIDDVFGKLKGQSKAFVDLGIISEAGEHLAYHGPYKLTSKNYSGELWFKEVMQEGDYMSDVFLGFRNLPHFVIAIAKREKDRTWIIRATIDAYMFSSLVENVRIGKTGEAYILNENGVYQTESRAGKFLARDTEPIHYPREKGKVDTYTAKYQGDAYLYATTWIIPDKWLLVVRQKKSDAFSELHEASMVVLAAALLAGMLMIFLAFVLSGRVENKLRQLNREKESLEEQLVRAQRLAELGEMAAGFAHEINNPLQIMKTDYSYMQMLFEDMREKGAICDSNDTREIEGCLDQINLQIGRCSQITSSILKFGRQQKREDRPIDLEAFIPEIMAMVEKKASVRGIKVDMNIEKELPKIKGDPGQLQQVMLNLLNNAVYAITAQHGYKGGKLEIAVRMAERDMVEIKVADNGHGISEEDMQKIFRPFFTTKPEGKGTGLGLSVCYGIVQGMNGEMQVSSKLGEGTAFFVRLPAMR